MEEQEIELWYDTEKEKLTQRFLDSVRKGNKSKSEQDYKQSMERLHKEFEKRMKKALESAERNISKRPVLQKLGLKKN